MNASDLNKNLNTRMFELEEKKKYYKLKRREKIELKELHKKFYKKIDKQEKDKKTQELKNEINKRQYDLRIGKQLLNEKKSDNIDLIEKMGKLKGLSSEEIKKEVDKTQLLEDMSTMGTIMKEQILSDKESHPEKYISEEEIIKNKSDEQTYALGIFSKVLENQGMVTAIEKDNNSEDAINTARTSMQFLVNGMSDKSKYDLHFDLGDEKNSKLLNDEEERRKFHDKLRKKLSKEYNIKEEDIIISFPRHGSYQVTIIFKSEDFKLEKADLMKKFQNEKDELGKLKSIEEGIIINGCCLHQNMLDPRGNNKDGGWAGIGEKRGGENYIPPTGWT